MKLKKLSSRFILVTLLVMVMSSLLAFLLTNCYYHMALKPKNDARVTGIVIQQKKFIENHPELKAEDFFRHVAGLNFQVMAVKDGEKKFYGTPFRVDNVPQEAYQQEIYHGIKKRPFDLFITGFFDNETENTVGREMKIDGERYYVLMRPDVGQSMAEFRIFLSWLLLLTMLFSFLFVFLSSHYVVRPVVRLKSVAKAIGSGNFDVSAKTARQDEIGVLANEMEQMKLAIARNEDNNKRFVANVSHEIQSPITNLLGEIKQLETTKDWSKLKEIEHQSRRLSGLSKQLLMLAQIEQSEYIMKQETFNAKLLITDVMRSMAYQRDQKEISIMSRLENIELTGNPELIFQMIENLLSNAIKYSESYSTIEVSLMTEHGIPVITIEDEGKGMDDDVKQHIFVRFYKHGMKEDDVPSNGLGMSIVKEIADLHGYELHIESELNRGTTVKVICHQKETE